MKLTERPNDAVKIAINTSGKNSDGNHACGNRNVELIDRRASATVWRIAGFTGRPWIHGRADGPSRALRWRPLRAGARS